MGMMRDGADIKMRIHDVCAPGAVAAHGFCLIARAAS
jgi:hypothetical protein